MSDENSEEPLIQTPADFGQFVLEKELGHGGMGGVYLGRDKMLDRRVGIKVMLKSLGEDPTFVERFQREAQAAARLNHKNIAQIYSFGQEQGMPYIAMELVPGGSLDKEMAANPGGLDPVYVMKIGQQMAEALAAAAEQGLVHGDVKPENVLFAEDGTPKLVDFGLAAMQGDTEEIWGTPYYISPEKCRRQKIDYRADIYSLGGTLYHALTGQPPFEGEDATAVVKARFEGPARKPSEVRPGLPPELDDILLRMLEVEPAMRYPTYQSLLGDIRRYLSKAGASATGRTAAGPRVRIKGRKPKLNVAGGDETPAAEGGAADLSPVADGEAAEDEKHMNVGLIVALAVGGVLLLIGLVVGGLFWYVHAEKAREERERIEAIVAKQDQARKAIATTAKTVREFGRNFHDLVAKGDAEMTKAVGDIKKMLPDDIRAAVAGLLEPPPTAEMAEAVAYTNNLLNAAAAPAEAKSAEAAPAADAAATNAPPADAKAEAKAEDAEAEKPAEPEQPKVELPAAVTQFAELWNDVWYCRAADIRVQAHVALLLAKAEAVKGLKEETLETTQQLAKLSQDLLDGFETLRGQKFVDQTQRKANVIRTRAASLVKAAQTQVARAIAKAEKLAREKAAQAAKEAAAAKAAEARKTKVAEETAAAQEKFDALLPNRLKFLDWELALRDLRRVLDDMTTPEGKDAVRTQMKKVECLKALQDQFIAKAKGFKFKNGQVVTAADRKGLTLQRQRQVKGKAVADKAVTVEWTRFYGKKEHVGLMNQLINGLVMKGRETTRTPPLKWSEQMFGAALTLQLLYTEVEGAAEFAPVLVKKAAEDFPSCAKTAAKLFPDLGIEATDE